jgi:hypothetical protein
MMSVNIPFWSSYSARFKQRPRHFVSGVAIVCDCVDVLKMNDVSQHTFLWDRVDVLKIDAAVISRVTNLYYDEFVTKLSADSHRHL